ncbi:MAG: putative Ig domain-containing protein [Candidatus Acidiferrales bacterium]
MAAGIEGATFSESLGASGGTAPYTWSLVSGALPPGLSLSEGSGMISGTPTLSGRFDFTAQVRDASGTTARSPLAISILTPTSPSLKVAFIADQGLGANPEAVLQLIANEGASLVIHSGDFDYTDNPTVWDQQIDSVLGENFPYFACAGNHDVLAWPGYQQKLLARLARISGASCEGDLGVQSACTYHGLFFLLTAPGTLGSGHNVYIRDQLAQDRSLWSVCSWHKNQTEMQVGAKTSEVGWEPYEECRQAGALIATGNEHSYHRTRTLSSTETQTVDPQSPEADRLRVRNGATFVFVSGLGGFSIREQIRCLPSTFPYGCQGEWAKIYTSTQGAQSGALFITFNVDGDPRKAVGEFKSIDGATVDSFTVTSAVDQ